MAKEIRRYELALDTDEEEAGLMKARMRIEEAQRLRRAQEEAASSRREAVQPRLQFQAR